MECFPLPTLNYSQPPVPLLRINHHNLLFIFPGLSFYFFFFNGTQKHMQVCHFNLKKIGSYYFASCFFPPQPCVLASPFIVGFISMYHDLTISLLIYTCFQIFTITKKPPVFILCMYVLLHFCE